MKLRKIAFFLGFSPLHRLVFNRFILSRSIRLKKIWKWNSKFTAPTHVDCWKFALSRIFFQLVSELQRVLLQKCTLCRNIFFHSSVFFSLHEGEKWLWWQSNFSVQSNWNSLELKVHKSHFLKYFFLFFIDFLSTKCNFLWFKGGNNFLSFQFLILLIRVLKVFF